VRSPEGKKGEIELQSNQALTDYALLPPRPAFGMIPLLAVATQELSQPVLSLYRADTGERFGQFNGHMGAIRAVAFSDDGRLLASAAADQTVCLWSLVDLDQTLNKQGQLRGVAVTAGAGEKGPLVVSRVEAGPAAGKVRAQDVVEGVLVKGELRRFGSPAEFYFGLLPFARGERVTLRLKGDQGPRDVTLPVAQAVVSRPPLLTFFLTAGGAADNREWIGWSPLGPHDSSSFEITRNLGWHLNTGKARAPTTFFPIDEKSYQGNRKEGLLKYLVARGVLGLAVKDWLADNPPPKPKVELWLEEGDPARLRNPRGAIRLSIANLPADQVEAVTWQLNGGAPQPFRRDPGADPAAPYEGEVSWRPGKNRVVATVRTRDTAVRPAPVEFEAHFIPPPPLVLELRHLLGHLLAEHAHPAARAAVVTVPQMRNLSVSAETFPVRAVVFPGQPGQDVEVRLFYRGLPGGEAAAKGPGVSYDVKKFDQGLNRVEVVAVPRGAPAAEAAEQTGRLILEVTATRPTPVPPPQIFVDAVLPLTGGETGPALAVVPGRAVIVDAPRVSLVGRIRAQKNLTRAEWDDPAGKKTRLAGFDPNKAQLDFRVEVDLKPGLQQVRLRAQAAGAKSEDRVVKVGLDYHPQLPQAAAKVSPPGPFVDDQGEGLPRVAVEGRLLAPGTPEYSLTVLVFLDEVKVAEVTPKKGQFRSAEFPLQPGKANLVRALLKSAWREAVILDGPVSYRRPPRIVGWEGPTESKQPSVELVARVRSPFPLKDLAADVNGRPHEAIRVDGPPVKDVWTVRLERVLLDAPVNRVTLRVGNAESVHPVSTTRQVAFAPPPRLTPPVVELVRPGLSVPGAEFQANVPHEPLRVEFRVRSEKPLRSIKLVLTRPDASPEVRAFDPAKGKPDAGGLVFDADPPLQPTLGTNNLSVVAENADGPGKVLSALNVMPSLPRLVLTRLEPADPGGQPTLITAGPDGHLVAAKVAQSKLWLHGEVVWGSRGEKQLPDPDSLVRVYVNDALQLPERLQPPEEGGTRSAFKVRVLLTRTRGNRVEVKLPDAIRLDENAPRSFTVDCDRPAAGQQLHVLVIAPGENDEAQVRDQVLRALQARAVSATEFTRPPFTRGILHQILAGPAVKSGQVAAQLWKLELQLRTRAQKGWPNDVVLIYFNGGEAAGERGQLRTLTDGSQALLPRERLEKFFEQTPGVRVLLLDVRRNTADQLPPVLKRWLEAPMHYAWIRSAWTAPAAFPPDARLLTLLRHALDPQNRLTKLGTVAEYLDRQFASLEKKYAGRLGFDQSRLPPDYREIEIAGPP
jgi:hypothetical protein